MEKPLKIRLHVISPLHIGCDEVYEPTHFVVNEKRKKLVVFDPLDFIKSLSPDERDKYSSICAEGTIGSIINIYKYLSNHEVKGREIEVSLNFVEHFNKVKKLPEHNEKKIKQELNQFTIDRTAFNSHNDLPYIPGSSLKGALRTAYLSKLAENEGIQCFKGQAKDLEVKLLEGKFNSDPFRMVKVSDLAPVNEIGTKVIYAINKKKKISKFKARGPYQILETIKEGSLFEGIINIQEPGQGAGIKRPIETKDFLKSIDTFFTANANNERKVIQEIDEGSSVLDDISEELKKKLGKSAFLIRMGRHSGAEAVTIEGNRHIKIMQGKKPPKFLDHATTIWFASDTRKPQFNDYLTPFGWAVLEIGEMDTKFAEPVALKKKETKGNKPFAAAFKKQDAAAESYKKLKVGDKIQGECFEEKGQLKLRVIGNQGEIISVSGSYLPWSPGQKVKVKIEKISQDGKILKIRP